MLADVVGGLPFVGDGRCRTVAANHVAQTVVHTHLVVEQVEARAQIVAVLVRIIDLANELDVGIAELHLVGGPCPEGGGHHLGHVAAEGIHALLCPEEQDVGHLVPSVGNGIVVLRTSAGITVVDAIVQFHGLVPVVARRTVAEAVVARCLGGILAVSLLRTELREVERLPPAIVEVVVSAEMPFLVIGLSKVFHALGPGNAVILACHVIGHEVHDDLQPHAMRTLDECLPLGHALLHAGGQVGVHVVIVADGIG